MIRDVVVPRDERVLTRSRPSRFSTLRKSGDSPVDAGADIRRLSRPIAALQVIRATCDAEVHVVVVALDGLTRRCMPPERSFLERNQSRRARAAESRNFGRGVESNLHRVRFGTEQRKCGV